MDRLITKKAMGRKQFAWISAIALAVVSIAYLSWSSGGQSAYRVDSGSVVISTVGYGEFQEYIPISSTVKPIRTFYLDAVAGGRIVAVFREEGSQLKVGDSILHLDNTDLRLDIMYREAQLFEQINNQRNAQLAMEQNSLQLRSDLLDADKNLENATRKYERYQKLREKQLVSDDEFLLWRDEYTFWNAKKDLIIETRRQDSLLRVAQMKQIDASIVRMQANLDILKRQIEDLVVRAPMAGQLSALDAEVGETKARGERLGQIDDVNGFQVTANVPEYYVSRVQTGLPGTVVIAGDTFSLVLTKVYPEVKQGVFIVELKFQGRPPESIRRGQTLQVRLALGETTRALVLDRGPFQNTSGGNWVLVVDPSGEFAVRRQIIPGRQNPKMLEVLDGLVAGDRVIISSYEEYGTTDKLVFKDK